MTSCIINRFKLIILLVILNIVLFSQSDFQKATEKTFIISKNKQEFKYLHFTFSFQPNYFNNQITDLYYKINYNEVGTSKIYSWVKFPDGHLINLKNENTQWKGPFLGFRDIKYKFYLKLEKDFNNHKTTRLIVGVFSTNPKIDALYVKSHHQGPFKIFVTYYDFSLIKTAIKIYQNYSNFKTVFHLIEGTASPASMATEYVIESIVIYAIEAAMNSFPLEFNITCNACGWKHYIKTKSRKPFYIKCPTKDCSNKARIVFCD